MVKTIQSGAELKHEITEKIDKMIAGGKTVGDFGFRQYADYMRAKLAAYKIPSTITERPGNTYTIDTPAIVPKHFHVEGVKDAAHRILGKFL
jgi:hypothetical protein